MFKTLFFFIFLLVSFDTFSSTKPFFDSSGYVPSNAVFVSLSHPARQPSHCGGEHAFTNFLWNDHFNLYRGSENCLYTHYVNIKLDPQADESDYEIYFYCDQDSLPLSQVCNPSSLGSEQCNQVAPQSFTLTGLNDIPFYGASGKFGHNGCLYDFTFTPNTTRNWTSSCYDFTLTRIDNIRPDMQNNYEENLSNYECEWEDEPDPEPDPNPFDPNRCNSDEWYKYNNDKESKLDCIPFTQGQTPPEDAPPTENPDNQKTYKLYKIKTCFFNRGRDYLTGNNYDDTPCQTGQRYNSEDTIRTYLDSLYFTNTVCKDYQQGDAIFQKYDNSHMFYEHSGCALSQLKYLVYISYEREFHCYDSEDYWTDISKINCSDEDEDEPEPETHECPDGRTLFNTESCSDIDFTPVVTALEKVGLKTLEVREAIEALDLETEDGQNGFTDIVNGLSDLQNETSSVTDAINTNALTTHNKLDDLNSDLGQKLDDLDNNTSLKLDTLSEDINTLTDTITDLDANKTAFSKETNNNLSSLFSTEKITTLESENQQLETDIKNEITKVKSSLTDLFDFTPTHSGYSTNQLDLGLFGTHDVSLSRFSEYFPMIKTIVVYASLISALFIVLMGVKF